jgi:transcription elongation factor GreB
MEHAISKEGFLKLKNEWEQLKYVERPAMQKQVGDAAAEGDRSKMRPLPMEKCACVK